MAFASSILLSLIVKQWDLSCSIFALTCTTLYCFLSLFFSFSFFAQIGNGGYSQLADGLEMCGDLNVLALGGNYLTDQHTSHYAVVVRNNAATLTIVDTSCNLFSSAGNAAMHRHTHLCEQLVIIRMGGSHCTDSISAATLCTVLSGCQHITAVHVTEYSLGTDGLVQLFTVLAGHRCRDLALEKIGLSEDCAPAINLILEDHRDSMQEVSLGGDCICEVSIQYTMNCVNAPAWGDLI